MNKSPRIEQTLTLDDIIFPNWQMFVYLAIVNFLVAFMAYEFIFTEEFYRAVYEDQMELARIDKYVDVIHRYSFWSMLAIPVLLLIKFTLITSLLQIPLLVRFIEISFKYLFRWVMLASLPVTVGQAMQYLIIYLKPLEVITPADFRTNFFSISALMNFLDHPNYTIFLLNQFNIFEIFWMVIIYTGLVKTQKISRSESVFVTVLVWFVILLLQWIFIYFFTKMQ
jgi:hypothetical protein